MTDDARKAKPAPRWRTALKAGISIAVVGGIFIGVFPAIADYSEVWASIEAMTLLELATLVLVGAWNLVTYWFVMVAVLPGLRYRQAAVVNQASTAVSNTLPGGGAIGVGVSYAMYSSWGFTGSQFALATVVSGVWNNFIKLGLPVVALVALAIFGEVGSGLLIASLVGIAVLVATVGAFALMLRSTALARRVGERAARIVNPLRRLVRRSEVSGWSDKAAAFCSKTAALVHDRWLRITVSSIISHLSLYFVLLIALRHVGISESDIGWAQVMAAFAFVRLISALPITPGGVGVVELGYTAALGIGLDDAMKAQVVAAVLVFRFITYFLPIPFGAGAYVFWRRNRSWRTAVREA